MKTRCTVKKTHLTGNIGYKERSLNVRSSEADTLLGGDGGYEERESDDSCCCHLSCLVSSRQLPGLQTEKSCPANKNMMTILSIHLALSTLMTTGIYSVERFLVAVINSSKSHIIQCLS